MSPYPVQLDVSPPAQLDRAQVLLRILVLVILDAFLDASLGWIAALLYLALPVLAAILVGTRGDQYLREDAPWLTRVLHWVAGFYAYMLLVTDRFPVGRHRDDVRLVIEPGGRPTIGGALLRLLTALPSAIVLVLLGFVSGIIWVIAAVCILVARKYPRILHAYQLGVLRWQLRLFAYQASLVEGYPPFSLDVEEETPVPVG